MDDLYNLCFCALLDGGTDHTPLTLEDAIYNMKNMQQDLDDFPAGITPEQFMTAWNNTIKYLDRPRA